MNASENTNRTQFYLFDNPFLLLTNAIANPFMVFTSEIAKPFLVFICVGAMIGPLLNFGLLKAGNDIFLV